MRSFLYILILMTITTQTKAENDVVGQALQTGMVWTPAVSAGQQAYVAFRKSFMLSEAPRTATLHLFADSRYMLWVNGRYVLRGPCRFNPKRPEYDSVDLQPYLHAGTNTLVVLVHHYAGAINGRIMRHAPGLTARLDVNGEELLATDATWRCSDATEYRSSPGAWSSIPDVIDGRVSPGNWTSAGFDDVAWAAAVTVDGSAWGKLYPRSIPLPMEMELTGIKRLPGGERVQNLLPIELNVATGRPWNYSGGFAGKWMWSPRPARKVWFKTVWSNAGYGIGQGSQIKVLCDNSFVLFLNGREVAHSADLETGWTGRLDVVDGDVITIEAGDLENGDRTAGLFVSMVRDGNVILETSKFLCSTTAPTEGWRTNPGLTGFTPLSATNIHPAHKGPASGAQSFVIDLGHMAMVYPTMELNADEGSVLHLQYALRYLNGQPAETYGVGTTYTARAGRQSFLAADQWCARYVTVTCLTGRVKILRLKMTERRYPFERIGSFQCSDPLLTRLWEMAVNTIECTSDDAYGSDARERNEWVQDASKASFSTTRIATAGPDGRGGKVYSDPRLLRNALRHAALSQIADGSMLGTFPTDRGREDCHYIIEDYNCQWVEALRTYLDATGDKELVRELWPNLIKQMQWFLDRRTPRGLLRAREYTSFDNPLAYITCEGATINAFFYQALRDSEYLAQVLRETQTAANYANAAASLATAFNQHFWSAKDGAYHAGYLDGKLLDPTVHAQLMALDRGLVPAERKASTRAWFLAHYKNPGWFHCGSNPDVAKMIADKAGLNMPVMYYWALHELYRMDSAAMDQEAISEIRRRWRYMVELQQDAGTLSEKFVDEQGKGASESCHNYGAVPAYFLSSFVLGVRRDGPVGDKHLLIEPRLGDLASAEGVVVTEFGPVPVSWWRRDRELRFRVEVLAGIHAMLRLPDGVANSLVIDDQIISGREEGRYVVTTVKPGQHEGRIRIK